MTTSTPRINTIKSGAALLILLAMAGCSSAPTNSEDRNYQYYVMYDEWRSCKHAYTMANAQWMTTWSPRGFRADDNRKPRYRDMRQDMRMNNCGVVLREIGYRG